VIEKQFIYKRDIAILLLMCVVAAFFFSVIFIELHPSHNCTGHLCATCESLNLACKVIRQLGVWMKSVIAASLICIVTLVYDAPFLYSVKKHITLINLKVILDD